MQQEYNARIYQHLKQVEDMINFIQYQDLYLFLQFFDCAFQLSKKQESQEFNSVIYLGDDSLARISILNTHGIILSTHQLNNFQFYLGLYTRFYAEENILYAYEQNRPFYYLIDFKLVQDNSSNFLTQLNYPSLSNSCAKFLIQKLQSFFYLVCNESGNFFIIYEKYFDALFSSNNVIYRKATNPHFLMQLNQFIQAEYIYIFKDGKQYSIQANGMQYLINDKYQIYYELQTGLLNKLLFQNNQIAIIKVIGPLYSNISYTIIFPNKQVILVQSQTARISFQIYSADDLQLISTFGDQLPTNLARLQNYFQYQNFFFIGSTYYELLYSQQLNQIQIKAHQFNTINTYYSFFNILDLRFYYEFSYRVYLCNSPSPCISLFTSVQQMYNMIPGCQEYIDSTNQLCKTCSQYYQLQNGRCVAGCEDGYYSQDSNCFACHQTCQTCNGSSSVDCLTCPLFTFLLRDNSCNLCNKAGYAQQGQSCSCLENYSLYESECIQTYLDYEHNFFGQQDIQRLNNQVEITLKVSFASSTVLSSIQNIFSSSSFGIIVNGLTCLKLSYLTLINSVLPQQIYSPLKTVLNQCPHQQLNYLNIFDAILNKNQSQYQNIQYKNFGLSFSIIKTSGQAIILFLICLFLFILFFVLLEKIQNKKVQQISTKIYNKIFSSFIIQYFQIAQVILVIGINQQIKEFFYKFDSNNIGLEITYLLILIPLTILILQKQYYYLNKERLVEKIENFDEITREKILNEAIFISKIRRNYMIIYQIFETILIPICFIQLSQSYLASIIMAIIIQLCQFTITICLRPFISKLTNCFFIIDSALWLIAYIQYLILNIYSSKSNLNEYSNKINSISYSFLINIQIILLELTVYLFLATILQIYDFFKSKQHKNKLENQQNNQISQIELLPKDSDFCDLSVANKNITLLEMDANNQSQLQNKLQKIFEGKQKQIASQIKN
ncbi:hypothetical protein ABPG74_018906 [Tetrahymena malaccensis]